MNLISGIKLYIEKMCTESGPGMKIILLDKETVSNCDNWNLLMATTISQRAKTYVYVFT